MNLTTFPKTTGIYLNWNDPSSASILRREGEDGEWTILATDVKGGHVEDKTAVPGVIYYYRVTIGQEAVESGPSVVLKETPLYGSRLSCAPINGNTYLNIGRIWRRDNGTVINLENVLRVLYQPIDTYDGRPVTDGVKNMTWGPVEEISPAECILPSTVVTNAWNGDDIGFNFIHTPNPVNFENPVFSYILVFNDGASLSLIFTPRQ